MLPRSVVVCEQSSCVPVELDVAPSHEASPFLLKVEFPSDSAETELSLESSIPFTFEGVVQRSDVVCIDCFVR